MLNVNFLVDENLNIVIYELKKHQDQGFTIMAKIRTMIILIIFHLFKSTRDLLHFIIFFQIEH